MGDGDCLFQALSFAYTPTSRHAQQDLHRCHTIMQHNKQQFKPFIIGPVPIDTHIKNMSKLEHGEHKLS